MRYLAVFLLVLVFPCYALGASVTFNWSPPATNCDGSSLNDLHGYALLWGSTPGGPYLNQHNVDDPTATSVTINVGAVENSTLYFVAVSVDDSGNRSDDLGGCGVSNEISVSFGAVPPSPPSGLVGRVN